MSIPRNISKSDAEYTRSYEGLYGFDSTHQSSQNALAQFGYLENMYIDYGGGRGTVESIPGYRQITSLGGKINALHRHKISEDEEYVIAHVGSSLYRFSSSERDSLGVLSPIASVRDMKSCAVTFGDTLYLFDGEKIICISKEGEVCEVADGSRCAPYIPIFYQDGERLEERNLLTSKFREVITELVPSEHIYETPGLRFEVLNNVTETCTVTGCSERISGMLYIPSYAKIDGKTYAVSEISAQAFYGRNDITAVITNKNLEIIHESAFCGCFLLKRAVMATTVREIGDFAFGSCPYLTNFYLNYGVEKISKSIFNSSSSLHIVNYGGNAEQLIEVEGYTCLSSMTVNYDITYDKVTVGLRVYTDTEDVISLSLDGEPVKCSYDLERSTLRFEIEEYEADTARRAEIIGSITQESAETAGGFLTSRFANRDSPDTNIHSCTVACVHYGRLFISGSDVSGGTVFFCGRDAEGRINPLYFPLTSYFTDGQGDYTVTALIPTGNYLAVFKSGDGGDGSIFYHSAKASTGSYPCAYSYLTDVKPIPAEEFCKEAVFLGRDGVYSIKNASGASYVNPRNCSRNVNSTLLKEDFTRLCSAKWLGYLVLSFGDSFYLADSRRVFNDNEENQYAWYRLTGVGGYENDTRVFRYATTAKDGYLVSDKVNDVAVGTVMSLVDEDGETVYYIEDGGTKYAVCPTEEYTGGDFYHVTALLSLGELLYFGTEGGGLYVFNNDKRGAAPDSIAQAEGFDAAAYERFMGREIHPSYYSFDGHAVRYVVSTQSDDCGIPHLTKRTVHDSLVVRFWTGGTSPITCSVLSDGRVAAVYERITEGLDFNELDFSSLCTPGGCVRISFPDKTRGWVEKSVILESCGFASPIAIHSIAYRYKIKGKIKNR